jgi:hypothetical protein
VPGKDPVFRLPNRVEAAGGSTPIWSMIETRAELEVRYSLCGSRSCLVELLTTCPEALKPRGRIRTSELSLAGSPKACAHRRFGSSLQRRLAGTCSSTHSSGLADPTSKVCSPRVSPAIATCGGSFTRYLIARPLRVLGGAHR